MTLESNASASAHITAIIECGKCGKMMRRQDEAHDLLSDDCDGASDVVRDAILTLVHEADGDGWTWSKRAGVRCDECSSRRTR